MRKTVLLLTTMTLALLVAGGAALAAPSEAPPASSGKPEIEEVSTYRTYYFEGPEGTAVEGDRIQVEETVKGRSLFWYDESGCLTRRKDLGLVKEVMTNLETGEVVTVFNTLTGARWGCFPNSLDPNAEPGTYPETMRFSGLNYSVRSKGDRTYTSAGHAAEEITWTFTECPTPGSGECAIEVTIFDENGNIIDHYIIPVYLNGTGIDELCFSTPHLQHFIGYEELSGLWERLAGTYDSPKGQIYPTGPPSCK